MQNAFLKDEVAFVPIPVGRKIVPNINRLADALRHAGGLVVWIQTPVDEETARGWSCFHEGRLTPARSDQRLASLRPGTEGHELWEGLDVRSQDAIVRKTRYSAFIQGSSDLEDLLRERSIDRVIVTGAASNVCCLSTAQDAMMRNFRTIMVWDANAAPCDEAHLEALVNFYLYYGDVMTIEEVIGYLGVSMGYPSCGACDGVATLQRGEL